MPGSLIYEKVIADSVVIAKRELEYCLEDEGKRIPLLISVRSPVLITTDHTSDSLYLGRYCSVAHYSSLNYDRACYGSDSLQALAFAMEVDVYLRFQSQKKGLTFYRAGGLLDYLDPEVFKKFYGDFCETRKKEKTKRISL